MRRFPRTLSFAVALAMFVVATSPIHVARADEEEEPEETAESIKKIGDAAFLDGRHAEALGHYQRSYAKSPDPALLYNIGRCHQELGDYPKAHDYFTRFAVEAPPEMRAKVPLLKDRIASIAAKIATVKIAANVVGAKVTINGVLVGESGTLDALRVNAGRLVIEASKDKYFPEKQTIDAPGGTTTSISLVLLERQTSGVLRLSSNVVGAAVSVDGKTVGNPPLELTVPAGTHTITASRVGYEPYSGSVLVPAGGSKDHVVVLAATPGITSKWWFWTGIGVVVVGGTILTYSLLTERAPGHGSYSPGQVSAGLIRF